MLPKHIGVLWGFIFSIITAVIVFKFSIPRPYDIIAFIGIWILGFIVGELLGFSEWFPSSPSKETEES